MTNPMGDYSPMREILTPARKGRFVLEYDTIPAGVTLRSWAASIGSCQHTFLRPYNLVRMIEVAPDRTRSLWMSDSPLEINTNALFIGQAKGRVLIGGLGIGYVAWQCSIKEDVTRVKVLEIQPDVQALVGPQLDPHAGVPIEHELCDVRDYLADRPKSQEDLWDCIYLDIWLTMDGPWEEPAQLRADAERHLRPGGVVKFWLDEYWDAVRYAIRQYDGKPGDFGPQNPCMVCAKTLRWDFAGLCMDCADYLGVTTGEILEK